MNNDELEAIRRRQEHRRERHTAKRRRVEDIDLLLAELDWCRLQMRELEDSCHWWQQRAKQLEHPPAQKAVAP